MTFLYPRTVSVRRPTPTATATGANPYGGQTESNETTIASGLAASIQHRSGSGGPPGNLPSDAAKRADHYIFIRSAALGSIRDRDIIVDDLGNRYQVFGDYWNSLGFKIAAQRLEM